LNYGTKLKYPSHIQRNLSFPAGRQAGRYPLNYGTVSIPQKYNQMPVFTTNWKELTKMG